MTPEPQPTPPVINPIQPESSPRLVGKPKKEKKKKPGKGVETLFRTTLSNHIRLSEMADRKANLMISINTLIVSIIISTYAHYGKAPTPLLVPSVLLLLVCLITVVVSLIATNPTTVPLTKPDSLGEDHPADLLFFGYYTRLPADEYRRQLQQLLSNDEAVYTSLINNIYAQGQVLARKYRLLKFAYRFFMVGFTVVVVLVIGALLAERFATSTP